MGVVLPPKTRAAILCVTWRRIAGIILPETVAKDPAITPRAERKIGVLKKKNNPRFLKMDRIRTCCCKKLRKI